MLNSMVVLKPENIATEDAYLGGLLNIAENQPLPQRNIVNNILKEIRRKGGNKVVKLTIPTLRDEEWRFTDLSLWKQQDWSYGENIDLDESIIPEFSLQETPQSRLVFVNGFYAEHLSDVSALNSEQVYVGNLSNLEDNQLEKIEQYLSKSEPENELFTALNSVGIRDAFVIWVKTNQEITIPIHLLHLTVRENKASWSQPRILVIVETNSKVNFVEYYGAVTRSCSDSVEQKYYFNNVVTEIHLENNAKVNHTRIQRESGDGFHIAKTSVFQSRDSGYTINEISLGGKLYRHTLHIHQEGVQTETNLYGLTLLQGKQLGDTHTQVSLNHPHGIVNQIHKYILDDSSCGVFNGKVDVPKLAQFTNASQLNRNLLLSPKARINTKPELQITADNVKCAHGATVSQLEADEIFYLRSRGLDEYSARHLLIDAFAADIINHIPLPSLQNRLTQCVACRTLD